MTWCVLEPTDPELQRAWRTFPDPVLRHALTGQVLEYLETIPDPPARWCHVFRHRCHPATEQRTYWRIPAPCGWVPAPFAAP